MGQEAEMYQSLLLEVQGARKIHRDIRRKLEGFADGEMGSRVPVLGLDERALNLLPIQLA
jgi:hypothetical protein